MVNKLAIIQVKESYSNNTKNSIWTAIELLENLI